MAHPTADWSQLHDRHYRKFEVYTMLWQNIDLHKLVVAGAPFGGPLAMVRDEKKILLLNEQSMKPRVMICTSSGKLISSFPWDRGQRLAKMGWTADERLLVVLEDGTVPIYSLHGEQLTSFSLGRAVSESGIRECLIWSGGLVALTNDLELIMVSNIDEPRPRRMGDMGLTEAPTALAIIEPQHTLSGQVEVLVATASGTILVVDPDGCQDQQITTGPFTRMAVSPNGKILACFTATGGLWVVSTDFTKNLSEFSTQSQVPPKQLVWCGTDSVLLYWDKMLLMVGPFGDWVKYSYDGPLVLVPEMDGVRVVSNEKCEFVQRVPDVTEQVFKIGSMAPAATLYDAFEHFEKKSPKADELVRLIRENLSDAVDTVLEAAANEFSHSTQRSLLRTASFGKCFLDFSESEAFSDVCRALRVCNAVRFYEVGIPITYAQYKHLGPEALVQRLVSRHHHLLALRISEFLHLRTDRVLVHWACEKVKTDDDDAAVRDSIVAKLADVPGACYPEIASTAYRAGRRDLAIMLLEHEPRAADQVPLLLSMQQEELALRKAAESGDTDLVYLVILHVRRTKTTPEFFRILRGSLMAQQLFIAYAREREQDHELLKSFYYQADRALDSAVVSVMEAHASHDLHERVTSLKKAYEFFKDSREHVFHTKAVDEEMRLLAVQRDIEGEVGQKCVGLPLSETVSLCVRSGAARRAMKLKSDFKIPDRRFWWLKVNALGEIGDWEQLERFAHEKKSPIGYEPFAEVCIHHRAFAEAERFAARVQSLPNRAGILARIGRYREAADIAAQLKDADLLARLRVQCAGDRDAQLHIERLQAQLR